MSENSLTNWLRHSKGWQRQLLAIVGLIVWSVVAVVIASFLQVAFYWALNQFGVFGQLSDNTTTVVQGVLFYVIVFIVLIGVPRLAIGWRPSLKLLGIDRSLRWIDIGLALSGLVLYFAAAYAVMQLVAVIFPQIDQTQAQDVGVTMPYGYERMLVFILFVIVGPIMEELIFRGYLQGTLRKNGVSAVVAIILVSVLFGAAHGQWNVGINVAVLGAIMSIAREITGTIWPGILMHMMKNGIAFYVLYVVGFGV